MQHPARLSLPLSMLALCACLLTGCESQSTSPPTETDTALSRETTADDLRTYYEAQLATLRDDLLTLKQEHYISNQEYESRLQALEGLKEPDMTPGGDASQDVPVGSTPSTGTDRPAETTPQNSVTAAPEDTAEPTEEMSFSYDIVDGGAVIRAYTGQRRDVVVPSAIAGYPVTVIDDNAFAGTGVQSVTVPASVTTVGWFAFYGCTALRWVDLPASVTRIEYGAFDACPAVTFRCPADSYAAAWAGSFGIRVEAV